MTITDNYNRSFKGGTDMLIQTGAGVIFIRFNLRQGILNSISHINPELALTHLVGQFLFPHLNLDLIPRRTTLFGKSCRNHIFLSFLKFPRKSINGKARNLNNQQQCRLACISLPYIDWTSYHSSAGGNTFLIAYRHQVLTYLPDSVNIHTQFVWHV